jgi:benzoyl-CoA reductase subunit C
LFYKINSSLNSLKLQNYEKDTKLSATVPADSNSHTQFIDLKNFDFRDAIYDIKFAPVKKWKDANPGKKVIGTFPVYVPPELIHAFGALPVNLLGGGEEISISHADAILGSFICSISKSTTEMLLSIDEFKEIFDGFVFPFICDVARNLSGIFMRRSDEHNSHMLHYAQNFESDGSVTFMSREFRRMVATLFPDQKLNDANLKNSIIVYNKNRELHHALYKYRSEEPWNVPLMELYTLMRMGALIPVEQHNEVLKEGLTKFQSKTNRKKDAIRVVITGNFCEQPPMDIIDLIEQVGCYVIDDEFLIGNRYIRSEINIDSDNLIDEISSSYIHNGFPLATRFHKGEKGEIILERVKEAHADGVIFLTAKFCEPALDDLVLQQHALGELKIPYVHIEYEERGSGYENIRLSLETFVESMLFD